VQVEANGRNNEQVHGGNVRPVAPTSGEIRIEARVLQKQGGEK
jgi:hypothetical protein